LESKISTVPVGSGPLAFTETASVTGEPTGAGLGANVRTTAAEFGGGDPLLRGKTADVLARKLASPPYFAVMFPVMDPKLATATD
jgi:hypothetical protein